jgi:hypothetical protein
MAFLTQNKAKLCKILIITLVYEKNTNFFAENCQKSQKIVIITSTPGANPVGAVEYSNVKINIRNIILFRLGLNTVS